MFQAEIHVQQDKPCVLDAFARRFDTAFDVAIEELHDHTVTFVIRVGHAREDYQAFFEDSKQVEHVEQLDDATYLVRKESCGAYHAVQQNHAVLRREASITQNHRIYQVLFFRREDLRAMVEDFQQVGSVSLQKVREFDKPSVTLTERQREVLSRALEEGYFEWPRAVDSEELADQLDISRATFHEHLRKAQSKLLADALERIDHADDGWPESPTP